VKSEAYIRDAVVIDVADHGEEHRAERGSRLVGVDDERGVGDSPL
jgi:hypothetical protein